jgi:hypothetical protein
MLDRYPGYNVLDKRNTPSWNEITRRVIDARLAMRRDPEFFSEAEWQTLTAVCDRIVPQPKYRPPVPVAAMIDTKMAQNETDGYRMASLPKMQEAWRRGLAALDADAHERHGGRFHTLSIAQQNGLLQHMQEGELTGPAWGGMPCKVFFEHRMVHDIVAAYYAHPTAWNEIGFGGPASPRGYVRIGANRRDPWEAAEAYPGEETTAWRKNRDVG